MINPETLLRQALDALEPIAYEGDDATARRVRLLRDAIRKYLAEPQAEPVAWQGAEEWESLAWELCADENGEDACNELIWEGGPVPEPWGDRWLKYEGEAKRLIALVRKHTSPPQAQPAPVVPDGMVLVTRDDANNYCRILTLLGMEEEGDPVAEIVRLHTPPPPAPDGWVMVPREPTREMFKAGDDCQDSDPSMDDSPSYYVYKAMIAAAPSAPAVAEMSPEFTDTARNALLWVLWHHQGASSKVGAAMRFALGMGAQDRMSSEQVARAKVWDEPSPHLSAAPAVAEPLTDEKINKLRDALAQTLGDTYVCNRVWEAWHFGTMSQDDFEPADQCQELLDGLIDAVRTHGIGTKGSAHG